MRWKNYGPADDTWEPVDNLQSCLDLVEDFQQKREEDKKRRAEERRKKKVRYVPLYSRKFKNGVERE